MLSILIPIYNYNAYPLVCDLEQQALNSGIEFEIICVDDASKSPLNYDNEKINSFTNATFFSNKKNLGFSSNRNFLASISKFNTLIFIDGDSIIIDKDFINKYLNAITKKTDIIYGSRIHPNLIKNPNKTLRWKYGKFVEDKSAILRSKNNYKTLMFNNTLIKKNVFESIKFDPCTDKYGHDDTLFAYQASLAKLKVVHIENAVMHNDIDENCAFIKKTETALTNLLHLYNSNKIPSHFVRILKLYKVLSMLKIRTTISFFFRISKPYLKKQLTSSNPSLFILNIYKIGFLTSIVTQKD